MKRLIIVLLASVLLVSSGVVVATNGSEVYTAPAQEELSFTALYERVSPSVVYIETRIDHPAVVEAEVFPNAVGSGFVVDMDGHIVTNNHVVANAIDIVITFLDGTFARAEVIGTDPHSDLAVLKVDVDPSVLHPVTLGDSGALRVGQEVAAIGHPFEENWTMTTGIVSAVGRTNRTETSFSIAEMVQTDAAINPGNSGGPLVDRFGSVVGVITMIESETRSNSGIGFAVGSNTVRRVLPELISSGTYQYTWVGITGQSLTLDLIEDLNLPAGTRGVLVIRVSSDSPASKAGVRGSDFSVPNGDIITGINGVPIGGMNELITYLAENTRPGDVVTLTILRNGNTMNLQVTLEPRPDQVR